MPARQQAENLAKEMFNAIEESNLTLVDPSKVYGSRFDLRMTVLILDDDIILRHVVSLTSRKNMKRSFAPLS